MVRLHSEPITRGLGTIIANGKNYENPLRDNNCKQERSVASYSRFFELVKRDRKGTSLLELLFYCTLLLTMLNLGRNFIEQSAVQHKKEELPSWNL
jgi:hypothetical protein